MFFDLVSSGTEIIETEQRAPEPLENPRGTPPEPRPFASRILRAPGNLGARSILRQAGMFRAFCESEGAAEFQIALIDGPITQEHPCFVNSSIVELASYSDPNPASAARLHATFVASILVGRADEVLGLCPACTILSLPAVDDEMLSGRMTASETARRLADSLRLAVQAGADLVLLGLEFATSHDRNFAVFADAVADAAGHGVRTVVPSGNSPSLSSGIVASAPGAVPVVLADWNGRPHPVATLGSNTARRGLLAPGKNIPGALSTGAYTTRTGSSFSAAIVCGAAGLASAIVPRCNRQKIWNVLFGYGSESETFSGSNSSVVPRQLDLEKGISEWNKRNKKP